MAVASKTRLIARVVIAALALSAFGVSHWLHHSHTAPAAAKPAPVALRDPPPAAPQRWQLGQISLQACQLHDAGTGQTAAAWCGSYPVPEDRTQPHGRQISLHLAVVRSDAQTPAADWVTILAGGPGQAATEVWPELGPGLARLVENRNVLLLDQRGTGGSNALTCHGDDGDADSSDPVPDRLRSMAQQCAAKLASRADVRMYTTSAAVADLEQVRQALGAPPLDLIGISYGTRVAQQFAGSYPGSVRSIVLDGVVPNSLALGQDNASNLDAALRAQAQRCQAQPACKQRFGDPYAALQALQQQLRQQPQMVSLRDPQSNALSQKKLDANSLGLVARMFAYSPLTMAVLPWSVDTAAHGDGAPLLAQAQLLSGQLSDSLSAGMGYSVTCAEDADLLNTRDSDANTVMGNRFVAAIKAICSGWPTGTRPAQFHAALHSDVPVLLLSGQYDPITPPRYAAEVAAGLTHARSLVLNGQGHNVILAGCTPQLVASFIRDLQPAAIKTGCLDLLHAPAFFVSANGAAP